MSGFESGTENIPAGRSASRQAVESVGRAASRRELADDFCNTAARSRVRAKCLAGLRIAGAGKSASVLSQDPNMSAAVFPSCALSGGRA
ncbi:MAG: hypothetical protein REI94_01325 [Moraxellaceae bacterium]|nr:hypothetical protein [Moraxellaceae bacterium]